MSVQICAGAVEDLPPDAEAVLGAGLDIDDVEPDVFSEVEEAPFTEAVSHNALPESEVREEGRGPGEDPSSEVDTCSMATAPQTAFSSSESCPITLTTAVVSPLSLSLVSYFIFFCCCCFISSFFLFLLLHPFLLLCFLMLLHLQLFSTFLLFLCFSVFFILLIFFSLSHLLISHLQIISYCCELKKVKDL